VNTARDIINYAETHNIQLSSRDGQLVLNAQKEVLTDAFLESTKQHKFEILEALTKKDRWNPELAADGYVWCQDCQHFNGVNCDHTDNPFRTVTKCKQAPRKCQWYKSKL